MLEPDTRASVAGEVGKWTAFIAGGLSIVIGVLAIFGFMDWSWFKEVDRKVALLVVFSGLILEILGALSWRHEKEFETLRQHLERDAVEQIDHARKNVDPRLGKLVGGEVETLFDGLHSLLTQNKFQLTNTEKFRGFYIKTLEAYPQREFWATSLPSSKYFWKPNDQVENAIAQFIHDGGKMKRIFFLSDENQLHAPETQQILARQLELGVQVYVVETSEISNELLRFFVVDSQGDIAWETIPRADNTIRTVSVIAGHEHTREYVRDFQTLIGLPCVHRYRGRTA